jgi:hypothetical protein
MHMKLVTEFPSPNKPFKHKVRNIYAVLTGDYVGQMFILVSIHLDTYQFLAVPEMKNINIPKDKFDFAINNTIIEFIEVVPRNFFKIIKKQFEKNEKTNNRWK